MLDEQFPTLAADDENECVFCGASLDSEIEKLNDECTSCRIAYELDDRLHGMDQVGAVCRALLDCLPEALGHTSACHARRLDHLATDLRAALLAAHLL